jgi:hypothetical protein
LKIDTLDWRTEQDKFINYYFKNSIPVVIKNHGFNKETYNFDNFIDKYQSVNTLITNLKTGISAKRALADIINSPDKSQLYVHNSESFWKHDTSLLKNLNLSTFEQILNRKNLSSQLFVGANFKSGTDFHCANNINIFIQASGNKKWHFVDPEFTFLMYPYAAVKNNGYFYSGIRYNFQNENNLIEEHYPLFSHCPRYEADLAEGDLLFNPPLWWHAVETISGNNISISNRIGRLAFSTTAPNDIFKFDQIDTNHLASSIQLFTPSSWGVLYNMIKYIVFERSKVQGQTYLTEDGTPMFEQTSHDNSSANLQVKNKIYKYWRKK